MCVFFETGFASEIDERTSKQEFRLKVGFFFLQQIRQLAILKNLFIIFAACLFNNARPLTLSLRLKILLGNLTLSHCLKSYLATVSLCRQTNFSMLHKFLRMNSPVKI